MNSETKASEDSRATLTTEVDLEDLPPRVISHTIRRPRFSQRNVPLSPYILIDGRKLRSSLALSKKRNPRRVNFPADENRLISGYLEPAYPWICAENVNSQDLILAYTESCVKHNTDPLETVISQLQTLDLLNASNEELNLKGQTLDSNRVEPLEEIFKRIQFNKIDLEGTFLDDECSANLLDMLEYYESAKHLNISSNPQIGMLGWQACADLIRKSQCLKHLEAKDIALNEHYATILSRALRFAHRLNVLNLENCGLSGRSVNLLVAALKMNIGIRELYLAGNGLNLYDAVQIASLLRLNNRIQLLDISNNNIQDNGIRDILEGLINQIHENRYGKGLNMLVSKNNGLTEKSSPYFSRFLTFSQTLEVLNIGENLLTDEFLYNIKDALKENDVLLQLELQSTALTCYGMFALSDIIEVNEMLERIDLRNNDIRIDGLKTLSSAMEKNKSITQIDLDDDSKGKIGESFQEYMQCLAEIRACCLRNEESYALDENSEGSKVHGNARNAKAKEGRMKMGRSTNDNQESDNDLCNFEDEEIDEFEEVTVDLEPQYQRVDMVTMTSEKSASCRKSDESSSIQEMVNRRRNKNDHTGQCKRKELFDESLNTCTCITALCSEDTPNCLVYQKMEAIVEKMSDESTGVPVKTVKSFMMKTPSVFTGTDLISWMMKTMDIDDQEALHVAHLMASHGYFFPIDDHCLTVRNDNTFYRFQTPYFWPSNSWDPENTEYAVYLCKRTMQNKARLELADYEAENLAKLQKMFSRKWEFIFMQAEAQSKVDKKRDKLERKVLDSQERAFWDVYRPMPGCVNTTELDIKKACRTYKSIHESPKHVQLEATTGQVSTQSKSRMIPSLEALQKEVEVLKARLDRTNTKVSKASEILIGYFEQYIEYDPFFTQPEFTNPWISDNSEMWEQERFAKEISTRRVKRWAFSLQELLQDCVGREQFVRFLDKEFSGENLRFWEAVQELKTLQQKEIRVKANEIWNEYLGPDASCPINVDSQSFEITKKNLQKPDRWCFDVAAAHVYHLMKSDSYSRYLRSEMYKDFLSGSKKKTSVKGIRSIVSFSGRKETATS